MAQSLHLNDRVRLLQALKKRTWKIETLYMDLGHLSATSSTSGSSCTVDVGAPCSVDHFSVGGGQVTTNTHFTDWILRGGLNYKF